MRITRDVRFTTVPEWIVLHPDLSDRAVRLWAVLDTHADKEGQGATPSRKRLAGQLRVKSVRSVDAAIRELVAAGAIEVEARKDEVSGDPTTNEYRLLAVPQGVVQQDAPPRAGSDATVVQAGHPTLMQQDAPKPKALEPKALNQSTPFDRFWKLYPRRIGKGAARKAFEKALAKVAPAELLAAVSRYTASPDLPEPRFVPHPVTWLNQERWLDEVRPPARLKQAPPLAEPAVPRSAEDEQAAHAARDAALARMRGA